MKQKCNNLIEEVGEGKRGKKKLSNHIIRNILWVINNLTPSTEY